MREHIIGFWDELCDTKLITLSDLKNEINNFNKRLDEEDENELKKYGISKVDINTYLSDKLIGFFKPFKYCPLCGEKIDWKGMKENEKRNITSSVLLGERIRRKR